MSGKTVQTDYEAGVIHNDDWTRRWTVGQTGFHQSKHDAILEKHGEKMFEGKKKSLFVPLCGKTPDMMWMYNEGHTVVGVEIVEQPIRELFEENSIEYTVTNIDNVGKLYKSKDGRLAVYCADLFDVTKDMCGQFDLVWDSRSLVAINLVDHKQYRDLMFCLMKPDAQYYLSTLEYDPAVWPGPPHSLSDDMVKELFGERCNIEIIEEAGKTQVVDSQMNKEKPSSAHAAMALSSYLYNRWYRLVFK